MGVAVAAVHPELVHVKGMVKLHRLGGLVSYAGVFGGEIVGHTGDNAGGNDSHADQKFDREPVAPAREDVGHGELKLAAHDLR